MFEGIEHLGVFLLQGEYRQVIDLYWQQGIGMDDTYARQQLANQAAMAYNYTQRHDSALLLIRTAIGLDEGVPSPYTTLAETFFYLGLLDSCWYYLDRAFALAGDLEVPVEIRSRWHASVAVEAPKSTS